MRSLTFRKVVDPRYTSEKRGSRRRRGRKTGRFGRERRGRRRRRKQRKYLTQNLC